MHINYNGKIVPAETPVIGTSNRGLRYGDGIFETMKFCDTGLVLADDHFERLWNGMGMLQFDIPEDFTPEYLKKQVSELVKHERLDYARVRLAVIRGNGGLYDLRQNAPYFIIEVSALQRESVNHEGDGARLCLFSDARKMADSFSPLKHNNYLPYCMAAIYAKKNDFHDALLMNQHGRICDSTMANIFIIKDQQIITPPVEEGCVAGIIRKNLVEKLPALGFKISEAAITEEQILAADEMFLTNSILNLRYVASYKEKSYSNSFTTNLFNAIKRETSLFC